MNYNKNTILLVCLAILALILVSVSIYIYKNNKVKVSVGIETSTDQTLQQQINNSLSEDDISDWETYRIADLSFKYPKTWYLKSSIPEYITITNYDNTVVGSGAPINKEKIVIYILTHSDLSPNETVESWANDQGLMDKQNILVDTMQAIRGKVIYTGQEESGLYQKGESSGDYVNIIYNGTGYQFVYKPYGSKHIPTFDKILSTIKFQK